MLLSNAHPGCIFDINFITQYYNIWEQSMACKQDHEIKIVPLDHDFSWSKGTTFSCINNLKKSILILFHAAVNPHDNTQNNTVFCFFFYSDYAFTELILRLCFVNMGLFFLQILDWNYQHVVSSVLSSKKGICMKFALAKCNLKPVQQDEGNANIEHEFPF